MNIDQINSEGKCIELADLWSDDAICEREEWLRNKREDVAIELTSLLHHLGISRADLARELEWKPSRVSKALSGNENLTLNTLSSVIDAAGWDFDLVCRPKGSRRSLQPWEQDELDFDVMQLRDELNQALGEVRHLHQSATITLDAAKQINRAMFRRAHEMKVVAAPKKAPAIVCEKIVYEENDEAIPRAA